MFTHTHLVMLGVATLVCMSVLHDAFASPRLAKMAAPVAFPAPQNAQRHLFTGTVFRAASIGY